MSDLWTAPAVDDIAEFAHSLATQRAPDCVLVRVFAAGIDREGRCQLIGVKDDYITRWEFAFYDVTTSKWLTVSWLPVGYGGLDVPHVDDNAGNCSSTFPLSVPLFALPSSGHIATRFAAYCDVGFRGTQSDVLVITHEEREGDVLFASNGQKTWRTLLCDVDAPFEG